MSLSLTEDTKGQPDGKVGIKVVQVCDWEPDTPPSPEEKKTETPRAPSCIYALHRELPHIIRTFGGKYTGKRFALGDRHGKPRFVESIASRQDLRRCGLCEEEVHDVEESTNAVRVGWTDRDESDWYTASNPDRILSVQVLCKRVKESMRQELESYLKDTYSLNTSLSGRLRVRTTVEGLKTKCGRRGKIRTEGPEETLKRKGHVN